MHATVTRRSLGAFLGLGLPAPAMALPSPDPIFSAIETHREVAREEASTVSALARASRLGLSRTGELRAEMRRLRKLRHSKRRELRRTTPTTATGFRALAAYHASLVPDPDPDDVAGQCQRDMEAACARATTQVPLRGTRLVRTLQAFTHFDRGARVATVSNANGEVGSGAAVCCRRSAPAMGAPGHDLARWGSAFFDRVWDNAL